MLTTNKIKLNTNDIPPKKGEIVVTRGDNYLVSEIDPSKPADQQRRSKMVKPKQFNPDLAAFQNVNKRETRKVKGDMLTTANYKDRVEASKPKPVKKTRKRKKR